MSVFILQASAAPTIETHEWEEEKEEVGFIKVSLPHLIVYSCFRQEKVANLPFGAFWMRLFIPFLSLPW